MILATGGVLPAIPEPEGRRTAQLRETVAKPIEKRGRRTYAKQQIAEKLALAPPLAGCR
jgi:hypothetical protein